MFNKSLNKIILMGYLGQDPERKTGSKGHNITLLLLATSQSWKDKEGQEVKKTEWHKIMLFDKLGDLAKEYLNKGSLIYVEGAIQSYSWNDDAGITRSSYNVVIPKYNGCIRLLSSNNQNLDKNISQTKYEKNDIRPSYNTESHRSDYLNNNNHSSGNDLDDEIPF